MSESQLNRKLFSEFPPVSTKEWEDKILADLKGADYNKKLIWKTDEGFDVKPYYRSEDLERLDYTGDFSILVDHRARSEKKWYIRQDIPVAEIAEANRIAVESVSRGADAIGFNATEVTNHQQMSRLLENIDLSKTCIIFNSSRSYPLTLELFFYEANHRNCDPKKIRGSLNFDLTSYLLLHGDFYISLQNNLEESEYLLRTIEKKFPCFRGITVNGHYFREAGSTMTQELAFALASANDYLYKLIARGLSAETLSKSILFSMGSGPDYFLEIAKFRAARILWKKILEQYLPAGSEIPVMFIHAKTILRNQSVYDPYVNMLRSVTESMSAAIGGADSISVAPFNASFKSGDEFSERIARNQQLIIKEEAYLDKVNDPAAGSYYIENLTNDLLKKAWGLFLEIEEKGGFIECIKSGFIQEQVQLSAKKRDENVATRKSVMIGVNQYPNLLETISSGSVLPASSPEMAAPSKYPRMVLSRDSKAFEELREATDHHVEAGNKRPVVYLLTFGNVAMKKARAAFTTNFFGCAGYSIREDAHIENLQEGMEAAVNAEARIAVLCSSDEEYADLAPKAVAALKSMSPGIIVVVAGFPKDFVESLKQTGVDDFIHIRSNLLETLMKYQKLMGVMK